MLMLAWFQDTCFPMVQDENGQGLDEGHATSKQEVAAKPEPAGPLMVVGRRRLGQGPEQVQTENRHPVEHGNPGSVERVADDLAENSGYPDDKLIRKIRLLTVPTQPGVVGQDEEQSGQHDEEDVGADQLPLGVLQVFDRIGGD